MYKVIKNLILMFFCLVFLEFCSKKSDLRNEITISVRVIDEFTKQPRAKDTVEIRMGKWGIPMRRYIKVGQYITDSLGTVSVRINRSERYSFTTFGANHAFGSTEFAENKLKDGQQIIIEVVPPERKKIHL